MDNLFENAEYVYACKLDDNVFSIYDIDYFNSAVYNCKYLEHDGLRYIANSNNRYEMIPFLSYLHENGSFFVVGKYEYNDIVRKRNCRSLKFHRDSTKSYGLFKAEILENKIRCYPSELMYYALDDDDWYWYENKDHIGSFFEIHGKNDFLIILNRIKERKNEINS